MALTDDKGNWLDPRGTPCPAKFVPAVEKRRDLAVERIHTLVEKLEKQMRDAKAKTFAEIEGYLEWLAKDSDVQRAEGKGNLTLTNFSGNKQVEVAMDDIITLDDRLQQAKTLVDEYILELGENAPPELVTLAQICFNTDKSGRVNQAMVLKLLKYAFKDPKWIQAVQLIRESIQVTGSRQYIRIRKRTMEPGEAGSWKSCNLNFSAM